jgi:hypothetical protein
VADLSHLSIGNLRAVLIGRIDGGKIRDARMRAVPRVAWPALFHEGFRSGGARVPELERIYVKLPFGRGVLVCEEPILVPPQGWEASLPMIGAAMTDAAERADRLCGLDSRPQAGPGDRSRCEGRHRNAGHGRAARCAIPSVCSASAAWLAWSRTGLSDPLHQPE